MSNSYDGASFRYLSDVYSTGQTFHSKNLDSTAEEVNERDFEKEVDSLKNKVFKEFNLSDDSELLSEIEIKELDLTEHNVGDLNSPLQTINSALVAVQALEDLMIQSGEDKTTKGDKIFKALKLNRSKLEQLRDLKVKQESEICTIPVAETEGVDFSQTVSTEDIAANLKEHILSVSKNSDYQDSEYTALAETMQRAMREVAKNPDPEARMRVSKTHNTSTINTSKGYVINPIEEQAKPIRSFWISKNPDSKSMEVQMIHSDSGSFVGEGTYKKVKLSSHFSIPLAPNPGEDKIRSSYTVLVRSSRPPFNPEQVSRHLKAKDPTHKSPDTSAVRQFIEACAAQDPENLWEQLKQTKLSLKNLRPGVNVAGVDSMRRDLFSIRKTLKPSSGPPLEVEQKKVEMEEKRYISDLTHFPNNTAWGGVLLMHDVAETLSEFHKLGIIHRDVKGPNILVDGSGDSYNAYLADFDLLTKPGTSHVKSAYHYWDSATRLGVVSKAADVYGFAMTLGDTLFGNSFGEFRAAQIQAENPQELLGPTITNTFKKLGMKQAFLEAKDACLLNREEFAPKMLEIIERHTKNDRSAQKFCEKLSSALLDLIDFPNGPILDDDEFNDMLGDKIQNIVQKTVNNLNIESFVQTVRETVEFSDTDNPDDLDLKYLNEIRKLPDLPEEARGSLSNCMHEVDTLTTCHAIIRKIIKANSELLHKIEKADSIAEIGDIEKFFPTITELQEDLRQLLGNLEQGETYDE